MTEVEGHEKVNILAMEIPAKILPFAVSFDLCHTLLQQEEMTAENVTTEILKILSSGKFLIFWNFECF